jgi:hypothetical protein
LNSVMNTMARMAISPYFEKLLIIFLSWMSIVERSGAHWLRFSFFSA